MDIFLGHNEDNFFVSEHQNCVRRKYENSLIYKHVEDFRHSFNFENTKILQQSKQLGTRRNLESFYSYANSNSINRYL